MGQGLIETRFTKYGPGYCTNDRTADVREKGCAVPVKGIRGGYQTLATSPIWCSHSARRHEAFAAIDCGTLKWALTVVDLIHRKAPVSAVRHVAEHGRKQREQLLKQQQERAISLNDLYRLHAGTNRYDWQAKLVLADRLQEEGYITEAQRERVAGETVRKEVDGWVAGPGSVVVNCRAYWQFGSGTGSHYSRIGTPDGKTFKMTEARERGLIGLGREFDDGGNGFWGFVDVEIWALVAGLTVTQHHWADPGCPDRPATSPLPFAAE